MDRYWLITWTYYGTWLAGDRRGFISHVNDEQGRLVIHNIPGTPYDADMPALEQHIRSRMTGPPVSLNQSDAKAMVAQYQETARIRGWELQAASVMFNHTHVVPGDPDPESLLETLKSWATRALKKLRPLPPNGTFWTAKGSKRKLPDQTAVRSAAIYVVCKQPNPLAVWFHPQWQTLIDDYKRNRDAKASQEASRTP